jgi:hypothetical protein
MSAEHRQLASRKFSKIFRAQPAVAIARNCPQSPGGSTLRSYVAMCVTCTHSRQSQCRHVSASTIFIATIHSRRAAITDRIDPPNANFLRDIQIWPTAKSPRPRLAI